MKSYKKRRYSLSHFPLNYDAVVLENNIIVKLHYEIRDRHKPHFVFFLNTLEAQHNEWATYGVAPDAQPEHAVNISFSALKETRAFCLGNQHVEMTLLTISQKEVSHPHHKSMLVPTYDFSIVMRRAT